MNHETTFRPPGFARAGTTRLACEPMGARTPGRVAAGHEKTCEAGTELLRAGGNIKRSPGPELQDRRHAEFERPDLRIDTVGEHPPHRFETADAQAGGLAADRAEDVGGFDQGPGCSHAVWLQAQILVSQSFQSIQNG